MVRSTTASFRFSQFIGCRVRYVMSHDSSNLRPHNVPRERSPVAKKRRRRITLLTNMPEAHTRKRIDNMNVVDHLLEHRFQTLSLGEKLEVKRLMSCALQSIHVFPVLYVPTAGLRLVVVASGL